LTADKFVWVLMSAPVYNSGKREWVSVLRVGSERRGSFWWISARKCTSSTIDSSCRDRTMKRVNTQRNSFIFTSRKEYGKFPLCLKQIVLYSFISFDYNTFRLLLEVDIEVQMKPY
jgi:hypothetical protein